MARHELNFRFYDNDNGFYVVKGGYLMANSQDGSAFATPIIGSTGYDDDLIYARLGDEDLLTNITIEQYVGISDCDGKKVYENDVISYEGALFIVVFDRCAYRLCSLAERGGYTGCPICDLTGKLRVVGTVHDDRYMNI